MMDQVFGGHLTRTDEKLWHRLSTVGNIGTLEIYSHGAITTGNLARRIDSALRDGAMRIERVAFYGVHPDRHLLQVLDTYRIPYAVRAERFDPVRIVTTPNRDLGGQIAAQHPWVDYVPFGRTIAAGIEKIKAGIGAGTGHGPYDVQWHDLDLLHTPASATPQGASPLAPSPVGGIALRGAGEALQGLGPLKGVALDEQTGRLVLFSEARREIRLPPLRLDDVVTIFRSVYNAGEAPFVSIDPNPQDPQGPRMLVRHGKATRDTFVGWILFEADRVMKAYSLGHDTLTRQPVSSGIPGYQSLMTLGFDSRVGRVREPSWERFWIVPASVTQRQAQSHALTLVDVPLQVKTQRMALRQGKLVPARDDTPSPAARTFQTWFTNSYAAIADEVRALPPTGCGVAQPVPVFQELQRLAVLAAIAERLRDQGVPMPAWIRDYSVTPCPMDPTTPALTVEASQTQGHSRRIQTHKIYGGVTLAPADQARHITRADPEAEALAPVVAQAIAATPPVAAVPVYHNGHQYQAVTLPGSDTREVGACHLVESDLVVPVAPGATIGLVRQFHSFVQPAGVLGTAWTLDLPRLDPLQRPLRRSEEQVEFQTGYQLTSPLHSVAGLFTQWQSVPEVQQKLLVPERPGGILGVASMRDPRFTFPTQVVLFRDGRRWHFNHAGDLVAMEQPAMTLIYLRDQAHRVQRIEGWTGAQRRATIELEYNALGLLVAARSSTGAVVIYTYDPQGLLTQVERPAGVMTYTYAEGLVTAVQENGTVTRRFTYSGHGRLQQEQRVDGSVVTYQVHTAPDGVQITAAGTDAAGGSETVLYDTARRPVYQARPDHTHVQWQYAADGAVTTTVHAPNGDTAVRQQSPDGRRATWRLPTGGSYTLDYDAARRLTRVQAGTQDVVRQEWRGDGRLARVASETAMLHPEYRADGTLSGLLVTPPGAGPLFRQWLQIVYNAQGQAVAVRDFTGADTAIGYDRTGAVARVVTPEAQVEVQRDATGRVLAVQTSWGDQQRQTYDPQTGALTRVELTRAGQQAVLTFTQGKLSQVQQFDGGQVTLAYYADGSHAGQLQQVYTPDGVAMTYAYDEDNRLTTVTYGATYRLVHTYDTQGRVVGLHKRPVSQ
jgi:YD repeat-containing protein